MFGPALSEGTAVFLSVGLWQGFERENLLNLPAGEIRMAATKRHANKEAWNLFHA